MAAANTTYGAIIAVFQKAVDNGVTFLEQIETEIADSFSAISAGKLLNVSGNGISQQLAEKGFSAQDAHELFVTLRKLYERAKSYLDSREDTYDESTTEGARPIKNEMLALSSTPIKRATASFSGII